MAEGWEQIKDEYIKKMIEELGLKHYFPGKITPNMARRNSCVYTKKRSDIPWNFLGHILELAYRGKGSSYIVGESNDDELVVETIDHFFGDEIEAKENTTYNFYDIFVAVLVKTCDQFR